MPAPSLPAAADAVQSTVTINGTPYASAARAAALWDAIDELRLGLGDGYDQLTWTISGIGPQAPIALGLGVTFGVNISGGGLTTKFAGQIVDCVMGQTDFGWACSFKANGLAYMADLITITDEGGGGTAVYNRSPTEGPYYIPADAGLSVGDIVARILTVVANATALNGYGIGAYTTLSPPTLPAATVADLANLTAVPTSRVTIGGEGIFNQLSQLVREWHPQYALWIAPDGTFRCKSIFSLSAYPLVLPGEAASQNPDPVTWGHYTFDVSQCYGAVQLVGKDVRGVLLSVAQGTLAAAWSGADQTAWRLSDYNGSGDAQDSGVASSVTVNSVTVHSDNAATHWAVNYWNAAVREGWIYLYDPAATGINFNAARKITATGALTAGGSCTITWDAGDPVTSLTYTRYFILGTAGSLADVGRLFTVREPASGLLGSATWIGQHLEPTFPTPVAFSNGSSAFLTSTPVAWTLWSSSGSPAYASFPATFETVPNLGEFRLTQPDVRPWATDATLNSGYPATYALGKTADVQILAAVNMGDLSVRSPSVGYAGTAQATYGAPLQRVKVIHLDDAFTYWGQATTLQVLADELRKVHQDTVVEGSIIYRGYPTANDFLTMGYAITLSVPGQATSWDGLNLPVISVCLRWPQGAGYQHEIALQFSNQRRPFTAASLYEHPVGQQQGQQQGGQMPFGDRRVQGPTFLGSANGLPGAVGLTGANDLASLGGPGLQSPGGLQSPAGLGGARQLGDFSGGGQGMGFDPGEFAMPPQPTAAAKAPPPGRFVGPPAPTPPGVGEVAEALARRRQPARDGNPGQGELDQPPQAAGFRGGAAMGPFAPDAPAAFEAPAAPAAPPSGTPKGTADLEPSTPGSATPVAAGPSGPAGEVAGAAADRIQLPPSPPPPDPGPDDVDAPSGRGIQP